ncbi:hypothetical protein [Brevibacterium aurantiacum]|uniref:LPXTG cell wall anchor domain-containing protein n=1 Tax=Brevibacterium aurantiacum TaxID=273384 RepID=A0A2H1J906_BREAU|nr:hypothetical protein [Brevibacterium aurantiacum]GEB24272.1 hypothetical protein BAU01nite_30050 [Brevibacterium aurantiacum]SMX83966.1 hypothetical protein BAUR9175_02193 [Brevibacterium aurantiacum]
MRPLATRPGITSVFALILALFVLVAASPVSASPQGQLTVTLPDGTAPKSMFAETTLVPGGTTEEKLIVSQNTGEPVRTGIRLEQLSTNDPLVDESELVLDGLGESVTVPLGQVLKSGAPVWLGDLPSDDKATVTIGVHLPESATNDTQRERSRFRIIVTAQEEPGASPPPTSSPTPTASPTDPSDASSDEDAGTDDSSTADATSGADDSANDNADTSAGSERSAESDSSDKGDGSGGSKNSQGSDQVEGSADAGDSDDPGGDLPRTGASVFAALLVAAALLLAGVFAVQASRRRTRSNREFG